MAFTLDELKAIAGELAPVVESLVQTEIQKVRGTESAPVASPAAEESPKGTVNPENSLENAPEYWVHLANGDVVRSQDSGSTHVTVDGTQVAVIGRYPVGE